MAMTVAQLMVRVGADLSDMERGLKDAEGRLSSFGKKTALTGAALTGGITLPLAGVAKQVVDTGIDYESAFNLMQAVSQATDEEMKKVDATAVALGADLKLPAVSGADALAVMLELNKGGLDLNETMKAARGTLQLAAAGELDYASAAKIATGTLKAFNLEGDQATDIADLFAAAANATTAEVRDIGDALQMASSVFAEAGIPVEHLTAGIGQMANAGIRGSDAGTSLKQMMLSLQAPTDKAAKLMAGYGISIYDAQGKMLPFGSIIDQFSTKLGGLSQQERNAALATIFGSDAVRAANIVLMGGVEGHQQMVDVLTREGAAEELAAARMKGLGGALQGLQSQIETVLLEAAEPFLGTLEGLARGLADLVPRVMDIDPNLRNAALAFAGVMAAAGPVLLIVGALATALGFLLSPLGLIVLAVAGLAAAWASNFGGIREITASVFEAIKGIIDRVLGFVVPFIQATLDTITAFWQAHGEQVVSILRSIWTIITTIVDTAIRAVLDIIKLVMQIITGDWEGAWETVQSIVARVWRMIQTIVGEAANIVQNTLAIAWAGIQDGAIEGWENVKRGILGIWDGIVQGIKDKINEIIGGINHMVTAWNNLGFQVPGFSVELPDWLGGAGYSWGGVDIQTPDLAHIPMLGAGALITRPTLAMLGERGPEAVVPLDRFGELAEMIAEAVAKRPMNQYNIQASYAWQDERSLRDDIRLLQMLGAST